MLYFMIAVGLFNELKKDKIFVYTRKRRVLLGLGFLFWPITFPLLIVFSFIFLIIFAIVSMIKYIFGCVDFIVTPDEEEAE